MEQWAELRREHFVGGKSIKRLVRETGLSKNTIRRALRSETPPRYQRASRAGVLDPFKPEIHRLLKADPKLPGVRVRELLEPLGCSVCKTVVDDYLREVRPLFAPAPRTFQRTVYRPGELCQFDVWQPREEVAVGHGQTRRAFVVIACLGYSRAGAGVLVFSKQTEDLLAGIAGCLQRLGGLPSTLVWDRQAGIHGHGGRPTARDPALARMEEWIEQHLAASDHEALLRRFAHWIVLRRDRRRSQHAPLNLGELGRAKAELASADAFLGWLADRGRQLEQCTQTDIDAWVSGPRKDRHIARQFARWAMAQKLMPPLEFPGGQRRGPAAPIVEQDPRELARRLLEDPEIPARERVAAILVAIYAQPIVRVARLTIDQIATTDTGTMTITLAQTPVTLPVPVSAAVRAWLDQRQANMLPLATPSPWLFPGNPPSRPMSEQQLSRRLKLFGIDCKHDRQAALLHLAGELPAAILADIVGVHVNTAGAWAEIAGRPWGDFPTLRGLH